MNSLTDIFHYGIVEERDTDPLRLGRCKVRIIGLHTEDKEDLPTKDLPWAYPMGAMTSASISGIGNAPVGLIEGTTVVIIFRDIYKQHPIILGSLGGIPEEIEDYETMVMTSTKGGGGGSSGGDGGGGSGGSGGGPNSGNGGSGGSGGNGGGDDNPPEPEKNKEPDKNKKPKNVTKPGNMKVSKEGSDWMKDNEGLASLSKDRNKIGNSKSNLSPSDKIYAYKDSGGVATIGWGNTFYSDGRKVQAGDSITKAEADALFDDVHQKFADQVNRDLKVPVTQSMFDSLVDMSYNMGHGGLTKSAMWAALNQGKYEEAAALIPSTRATVKGKPNKGLDNRRKKEKDFFLKDGIPSKDGSKVEPDPSKPDEDEDNGKSDDKTNNPAVRPKQKGDKDGGGGGSGDGEDEGIPSQTFAGSIINKRVDKKTDGFRDPNKKYPLEQLLNEPDTNRLARHESIDGTIVPKKEAARVINVKVAKDRQWSQPEIPYNAQYPFNQVFTSEAGHVQEFDNTKGNERIHTYHISGTFEEIDKNGTLVRRIVGDGYEIFEQHGYILIKGTANITVQGSSYIRVENNANLQVLGNCNTEVTGNMNTTVKGNYKVRAKNIQMEAYDGDMDVKVKRRYSEDISEEGVGIFMNCGVAVATGLDTPEEEAPGEPQFPVLQVPSRGDEWKGNYESEEEGDSTVFIQSLSQEGNYNPPDSSGGGGDNEPPKPEKPKEESKAEEKKEPKKTICEESKDYPLGDGPYSSGTKLNSRWSLGDVCRGRSGIPSGKNYGLSSKDIVVNLQILTNNVIDPVKKMYPNMIITNTWRSEAVNSSLKGASKTSDHLKGSAVDIQFSGFNRKQTYEAAVAIQKALPDYDQMLLEYSGNSMWLHISFKCQGMGGNRREIRTIDVNNRKNNVNGKFVLYEKT